MDGCGIQLADILSPEVQVEYVGRKQGVGKHPGGGTENHQPLDMGSIFRSTKTLEKKSVSSNSQAETTLRATAKAMLFAQQHLMKLKPQREKQVINFKCRYLLCRPA
jgi:hypothetical protein